MLAPAISAIRGLLAKASESDIGTNATSARSGAAFWSPNYNALKKMASGQWRHQ